MKKITIPAFILILTVSIIITAYAENEDITPGKPYNITNNYAQDSSAGFVVQWHDKTGISKQLLQIVKVNESFDNAKSIAVTGFNFDVTGITECPSYNGNCNNPECSGIGNYEKRNIFRAEVTGLSANTKYKYRVGAPLSWSETYFHLTSSAAAADFSFTVVTDTQDSVFSAMRRTLNSANAYDSDNRFFIHAGDVVDYIGLRETEIENYTKAAAGFNRTRPVAATQGNHDTYHNKTGDQYVFGEASVFNAYTVFPNNGFVRTESNYDKNRSDSYYFYYNRVLIVMLNTFATSNETGTREPDHYDQEQWFRNILQKDKNENLSDFRIVVSHIPPFAGRGSSNNNEPWLMEPVRRIFAPICTEFKVDIFFAGHDHVYGRSNPIIIKEDKTSLAEIEKNNPGKGVFGPTEGGTIYTIAASTGPKTYVFRNPSGTTNQFIPKYFPVRFDEDDFRPGLFINVKVSSGKMIVTAMIAEDDLTSTVLDTYEVIKK